MGQTEIRLSMPILFNWIFVILKAIGPNQYFFDYICFGSLSFVKALWIFRHPVNLIILLSCLFVSRRKIKFYDRQDNVGQMTPPVVSAPQP